jgi:hypothetical protein
MFAFLLNLFEYIPSYIHQSNLFTLKDIFFNQINACKFFQSKVYFHISKTYLTIRKSEKYCLCPQINLTKSSQNRSSVKSVDDWHPALQMHEEAGHGHVDHQLVAGSSQSSMSKNRR